MIEVLIICYILFRPKIFSPIADTAFMYILGCLLILRLFQSRHPDINAHAHKAYFVFAVIIILAVVGVVSATKLKFNSFCIMLKSSILTHAPDQNVDIIHEPGIS